MSTGTYRLETTPGFRRAVAQPPPRGLPRAVAAAVMEFVTGPLLEDPGRVGKPLIGELAGHHVARRGPYRVIYRIDDAAKVVTVLTVAHRSDAYRSR